MLFNKGVMRGRDHSAATRALVISQVRLPFQLGVAENEANNSCDQDKPRNR